MLVSPFAEDDSGDYYCDMCETKRNPEIDVYYCAECNYIAHIDCVLFEVLEPLEEMLLDPQRMEENFENGSLGLEMILRAPFHPHSLIPNDDDEETIFVCDKCEELCICSRYSCKLCSFILDSRCATLEDETSKERNIKTLVNHFCHLHQITRCKIEILQTQPNFDLACMACRQRLCGIIYASTHCSKFFIHESCLKHMLMEVQSLFHP
ncbi:hypothetical protein Goshw_028872 [Gossypium schwendimanii]|uniref:DC1 domain-containing protein n=1 Tax=Gossypium schwendimanii TaxID=34291 RepID=A0A7J9N3E1_GOSSC|nr:hypothetical protein [Gossypium schwendimanii]